MQMHCRYLTCASNGSLSTCDTIDADLLREFSCEDREKQSNQSNMVSFPISTSFHFVQYNASMYICLLSAYSLYYPLWRGYASCIFGLCYVVKLCNSFASPSSGTSLIVSAWQPTKQPVPTAKCQLFLARTDPCENFGRFSYSQSL